MKKAIRKIKNFFIYRIDNIHIRVWESIKQLIAWFPIIWETRDWDRDYLLEMMEFKMKRMYDALTGSDAMGIQEEDDMLALKRCVAILNLLQNEGWQESSYGEHYAKFPMKTLEEMFQPFLDEQGRRCNIMKPMTKAESRSFGKAVKQAEKDHKKLINEFFQLFEKHYRNWWD
jgi:hypothetical protein